MQMLSQRNQATGREGSDSQPGLQQGTLIGCGSRSSILSSIASIPRQTAIESNNGNSVRQWFSTSGSSQGTTVTGFT